MRHELKTWPQFFARLVDGSKTFEIRKDDRVFQAGDTLVLREYDPSPDKHDCDEPGCSQNRYSGKTVVKRVGFVAKGDLFGLNLGPYAVLSLLDVSSGGTP
jgi:hypothetical protein